MTTMAANPGTGIGTTSGMAKNISDVPKEVSPIELIIFSSLKSSTSGLLARISRRICEVRALLEAGNLAAERFPVRVFFVTGGAFSRGTALFAEGVRAVVFFALTPGSLRMVGERAAEALMEFFNEVSRIFVDRPPMSSPQRRREPENKTKIVCKQPLLFLPWSGMLPLCQNERSF